MSRSAAAKKRRNQAKNLKRKQNKNTNTENTNILRYDGVCNVFKLPVVSHGLIQDPIELIEYWCKSGWFFVTTDHRMQCGERNLPVVVDSMNKDVCEIASWISCVPHDCDKIPVLVYEKSEGNYRLRKSFVEIRWPNSDSDE